MNERETRMEPSSYPSHPKPNRLLATLQPHDLGLLKPHLQFVTLAKGQTIYRPGEKIEWAYFPQAGLVSLLPATKSTTRIETAAVGSDSALGTMAGFGRHFAACRSVVTIRGHALRISAAHLQAAASASAQLRDVIIFVETYLSMQAHQTCVCNTAHKIDARICRWLLDTAAKIGVDSIAVTQKMLADFLGVHRGTLSPILTRMQKRNLIKVRARDQIIIVQRDRIEASACECHTLIRSRVDQVRRRLQLI
jgi:CRP-like cAMP-binding protein